MNKNRSKNNVKKDEMLDDKTTKRGKANNNRRRYKSNKDESSYKKDAQRFGANDISWYATDPTLLRNVGNLPWSTQTGITYNRDYDWKDASGTLHNYSDAHTVPGFNVAYLLTGPGRTEADIDAVNISANAIYTFVRHMNSGSKNYDAPDLMSYLLAMDEVFTYINWLQRLYGTIAAYNVFNRYTPEALIRAQGVDYNDLRDNMVTFKYRINLAIKQAATLVVPNNMPIYFRHAWLYQNYYIEGNDIKDQIYFYSPISFKRLDPNTGNLHNWHIWDTTSGTTRTMIPDRTNTGELIGVDTLCNVLDDMVRVLYTNEDTGIMAGDILKAYGEANIMRLSELPDAYVTPILPNNEVLLQFKNSNSPMGIVEALANPSEFGGGQFGDIILDPNTNKIYWSLFTSSTAAISDLYPAITRDNILTLEGDPSVEMNMIMTRLMSYSRANGGDTTLPSISIYGGTEVVGWYSIISDPDPFTIHSYVTVNFSSLANAVALSDSRLSNFKYHPRSIRVPAVTNWEIESTYPTWLFDVFQMDNFTYIKPEVLDRLHQVAIMSELNVPHMALTR